MLQHNAKQNPLPSGMWSIKPSDDIKLKTALNQCLDILEDLKTSREDSLEEIAKTFERLGYRREA